LLAIFEPRIYSATMVERGKPAPDLFLLAAREMGACPEDCVVIEVSPARLTAARSARMRAFAFTGGGHAGPGGLRALAEAIAPDAIFDDLRDLPSLIAGLRTAAP
jgi:beta-phosphoglucomutase-like phosphatase (HAD superfamily)